MFMMTTVLVLLQTTIWSMFLRIQGKEEIILPRFTLARCEQS